MLGVLCIARLTMRSPSSKRPSARAARGRVPKTRKPSLAGSRLCMLFFFLRWLRPFLQLQCSTKPSRETYGLPSLASVAALACLAVLGVLCVARFPFHDSQVYVGWFFGSQGAPRRPKSDSQLLVFAPRASKSAPRALQEAFRGLPRRRCDSDPVWDPFLASKSEPWDLKNPRNL